MLYMEGCFGLPISMPSGKILTATAAPMFDDCKTTSEVPLTPRTGTGTCLCG